MAQRMILNETSYFGAGGCLHRGNPRETNLHEIKALYRHIY